MLCEEGRSRGWCGLCFEGLKGKAYNKGHAAFRQSKTAYQRSSTVSYLKRQEKVKPAAGDTAAGDESMSLLYPATHEFLAMTVWDDGKPRQTGTVMLLAEEGLWKAWVHDRDAKRSAWISGHTVEALLALLEQGLLGATMAWRTDKR